MTARWSPDDRYIAFEFRPHERTEIYVVDVGGGSGTIMAALLDRNPRLRGSILELSFVVAQARAALAERGLSSRCEVVEGDFFKAVPEADIHILKRTLKVCGQRSKVGPRPPPSPHTNG